MPGHSIHKVSGFTLVEVVIGIVVMAFALTFITTVFFADPGRSVRPMLQIRAAEFGQALMDEILAKSFDETTPIGGVPPCTAISTATGCTAVANLGRDGTETRPVYDDVDDYDEYCIDDGSGNPGWPALDALNNTPGNFDNFRMRVCVIYDGDYNGTADADVNAKLITVAIYPPSGAELDNPITISTYRGNF